MNETNELDDAVNEDAYPLQKHLGFRMVEWREDYARFELPMQEFLGNRYGIPHGGVYATLADTVMGFCGCYTGDAHNQRLAMTLSLNVSFVAQMKGTIIIGEGFRVGGGRKTFFSEAKISDNEGTLIATATGVFRYRSSG